MKSAVILKRKVSANFIFCSGRLDPIPVAKDDRRFMVSWNSLAKSEHVKKDGK